MKKIITLYVNTEKIIFTLTIICTFNKGNVNNMERKI